MEFFNVIGDLAGGFATALMPFNILMLLVGIVLGLVVGVLPGLGGTSAVAILLPITVIIARTSPTSAVILLAGVYWGALFGGVVTSILFNIPGEPWSVVLLFDGFPLAKRKGRPGLALSSSFLASFVGALLATLLFTFFSKPLADIAIRFGPPELFAVFILSFTTVIGFFFGSLPGHGATAGSFLGYGLARQYSKNKADFGKGEISGIMAPQAAADSAAVGSLVPMIALGVPGSPTSAVIMAGLFIWGLNPGPLLFVEHKDFVWGLIASVYLGHLLTFLICLTTVPLLAMIMRTPYAIITPFIVIISVIGAYSLNNSLFDVGVTVVFGVVGYWLRKMKYPLAPLVVALVLGDSTERTLRQSLIASGGNPLILVQWPIATILMALAVVLLLIPLIRTIRSRGRPRTPALEA